MRFDRKDGVNGIAGKESLQLEELKAKLGRVAQLEEVSCDRSSRYYGCRKGIITLDSFIGCQSLKGEKISLVN